MINGKMDVLMRCHFGGAPKPPPPPKPPVPPSKEQAAPAALQSLNQNPKSGRESTILGGMLKQNDAVQRKTLLGG